MKTLIAGTMLLAGIAVAAPAMAQGIYVGPGGVGVDSGLGYGHRHYDRDYRNDGYRHRRDYYEGRSAYRGDRGYGDRGYNDRY